MKASAEKIKLNYDFPIKNETKALPLSIEKKTLQQIFSFDVQ